MSKQCSYMDNDDLAICYLVFMSVHFVIHVLAEYLLGLIS